MPVKRGIEEGEPQDTEGNAMKPRGVESGENETDTEGQAFKWRGVEDGEPASDDSEGQGIRGKGGVETGENESDDTEGNKKNHRG